MVRQDLTEEALRALGSRPLVAGDDYDLTCTAQRNGVAIDLTAATVWFTVKESSVDADAQAKLSLKSDQSTQIEITDPTNGIFVVKFRAASTADIEGEWVYDIQISISSGIITLAMGSIEFLDNITRETS